MEAALFPVIHYDVYSARAAVKKEARKFISVIYDTIYAQRAASLSRVGSHGGSS